MLTVKEIEYLKELYDVYYDISNPKWMSNDYDIKFEEFAEELYYKSKNSLHIEDDSSVDYYTTTIAKDSYHSDPDTWILAAYKACNAVTDPTIRLIFEKLGMLPKTKKGKGLDLRENTDLIQSIVDKAAKKKNGTFKINQKCVYTEYKETCYYVDECYGYKFYHIRFKATSDTEGTLSLYQDIYKI